MGYVANCDKEDVKKAFLEMYANYDSYKGRAMEGRFWAKQYQWKTFKKRYLNIIKPKKVILGDRNIITDDYLMTDSKKLFQLYTE